MNENAVLVHVSRMSFLSERFLRFVLIVWSLYIRVSITLIVFLMGTLVNNNWTSKDIFIPIQKQAGWNILNAINGLKGIFQSKLIIFQWM